MERQGIGNGHEGEKIDGSVSPVMIDRLGMLVRPARYEKRTIERKLHVCGQIIPHETPQYTDEYAIAWALVLLRSYIASSDTPQCGVCKRGVHAGNAILVYEFRDWFARGLPRLESAADNT